MIPSCIIMAIASVYWYRLTKLRAKTDREWIVNSRTLNFQRHKKNEFGDDNANNFVEENTAHHEHHDQDGRELMI